jgi:hypothetical protein
MQNTFDERLRNHNLAMLAILSMIFTLLFSVVNGNVLAKR